MLLVSSFCLFLLKSYFVLIIINFNDKIVQPEIIVPNAIVKATNGSNAVFDCIVEAYPNITYEWQFGGRLLTNETESLSSTNSNNNQDPSFRKKYTLFSYYFGEYQTRLRLVVHRLNHYDYGTYQLRVRNLINVTTARLELHRKSLCYIIYFCFNSLTWPLFDCTIY